MNAAERSTVAERGTTPRSNRGLAWATVALLLLAIFDLGRVTYCSVRLRWAVEHFAAIPAGARAKARTNASPPLRREAAERIRRLSGLGDLSEDSVRVRRTKTANTAKPPSVREPAPERITVSARYPVGLVSPYARAYFGERGIAVDASETFELASADIGDY